MNISRKEYDKMTKKASPPSKKLKNAIFAFVIGGFVCTLGEAVSLVCEYYGMSEEDVRLLVPVSLIVLSAILTALGIFDDIALHAGAGTIVPITGFANSIVSPALEFKSEGFITGMAVKMFMISGPVIVYGIVSSAIYGVIYWIITLFAGG